MKTFTTLILAAALTGCTAMAHDSSAQRSTMGQQGMQGKDGKDGMHAMMQQRMQAMDTNKDGMLSREEFIKAHEAMYDAMPKNEQGLVDMKRMHGSMHR